MKNIRRAAKLCLAKYALRGKVHAMPHRSDAEEHLRIIRSLMEKATIYRAISAEAAAVGGVLAITASFAFGNYFSDPLYHLPSQEVYPRQFVSLWLCILCLTSFINAYFLYRSAVRRGEVFCSPGMRLALKALIPSFVVAGVFTVAFIAGRLSPFGAVLIPKVFEGIVPIWITCYGLALLATSHFAPRSLWWLGWAFLIAGLISFFQMNPLRFFFGGAGMWSEETVARLEDWRALFACQRWMAGTFGLFHLIYAACTWPRRGRGAEGGAQP